MKTLLLLLCAGATLGGTPEASIRHTTGAETFAPGGPPRVAVCGKSEGGVSRTALIAAKVIELHGCVPSARIVAYTLRFSDGNGAGVEFRTQSAALTKAMIEHLRTVPVGTWITVADLEVTDEKGTAWKVPDARYTLTA